MTLWPLALAALGICFIAALWRPSRLLLILLLVLAVAWLFFNKPIEGPVIYQVSENHGLTTADLVTPVTLLVAACALVARRRRAVAAR